MKLEVSVNCHLFLQLLIVCCSAQGQQIRCACTPPHCRDSSNKTCTTKYKCYTQYLDKGDGSNPLTRGCTSGPTPILCENRLPAVDHNKWPYLVCCGHDFCNSGQIPMLPPWYVRDSQGKANSSTSTSESGWTLKDQTRRPPPPTHPLLRPLVLSVLIVGIILLIAIMAIGSYVLRRQSKYLRQGFPRNGYVHALDTEATVEHRCSSDDTSRYVIKTGG